MDGKWESDDYIYNGVSREDLRSRLPILHSHLKRIKCRIAILLLRKTASLSLSNTLFLVPRVRLERESLHRSRWLVFAFFNRTSLRSRPLSSFLIVIYCQNSVLYLYLFLCERQRLKSTVTGIIFSTCSEFHSLFPSSIGSLFSSAFQKLLEVIFGNETKFESFALIFRVDFPSSHTWREVVLVLFVVWDWNWNCSGRVLSGFSASNSVFLCSRFRKLDSLLSDFKDVFVLQKPLCYLFA